MERIIIEEDERNTIIELENREYRGNSFYNDGRIETIKKEDFDIFKSFLLSNNHKRLPNEGEYKVILDNKTGFKHYFLNDVEDFMMFFQNNGEEAELYKVENKLLTDNGWRKKEKHTLKEKIFRIGKSIVRCTNLGFLYIVMWVVIFNSVNTLKNPQTFNDLGPLPILSIVIGSKDIEADYLIKKIRSSERLETEDQLYLANRDFLEDILVYANKSNYAKYLYYNRFNNIGVKTFEPDGNKDGYFIPFVDDGNNLYIANNRLTEDFYNNIISHEFIHLCQAGLNYNVLTEATAEILSFEYFDDARLTSYSEEVYLVKKMMEIIGPEPILHYVIGGNFDYIRDAIKPYLTNEEYVTFLNDLSRPNYGSRDYNEEENKKKFNSLDELLNKVYENKYGMIVNGDPILPKLSQNNLIRYYFNHRKKSYYMNLYSRQYTLKEAMEQKYVYIYQEESYGGIKLVSYDEYMNSTYDVTRGLCFNLSDDKSPIISKSLFLGDDYKLYLSIVEEDVDKREYLPTVEEKIESLINKTK